MALHGIVGCWHFSNTSLRIAAACAFSTLSPASIGFAASKTQESPGFVMEFAAKESDVLPIVKNIADDSIVRGTYVFEKDKTLTGAIPAQSSGAFEPWTGPGEIFYKVVTGVLAPHHFDQSSDIGTITVRYVVQHAAENRTRVRVDAIFIEDARRK